MDVKKISLLLIALVLIPSGLFAQSSGDIDGDGITDGDEDRNGNQVFDLGETDWRNADSDNGGEADGSELRQGRDPLAQADDFTFDQDGDGLTNGEEALRATNPKQADSDGDGLSDRDDPFPLEAAFQKDADGDQLADEWEEQHGLSTETSSNANNDDDGDGLPNREEFVQGTDPTSKDTDRDGVEDAEEVSAGTDPEESACLSYREQSQTFTDLVGHWAEGFVKLLTQTLTLPTLDPVIRGYDAEDGTRIFLPNREITRFELLKIALYSSCIHLKNTDELTNALDFKDLPKQERPRESSDTTFRRRVIYTAADLGIVQGYEDPNGGPGSYFQPDASVTRAEALKMLLLASRLEQPTEEVDINLTDVSDADWFAPYIKLAIYEDLIEGYEDGTFRPNAGITRAEAAKVVHHIMLSNPFINGYVLPNEDSEETEESEETEASSSSADSSSSSVSSSLSSEISE